MVVRVAQRAQQSQAQRVVVAADDALILKACQQHGIEAVLTDKHHASGSDRLAQACEQLGLQGDDIVVNVQGDEPLIDPALINAVAGLLATQAQASMGTAAHPIASRDDYLNPNVVKVVLDAQGLAHYFSRAPIPWSRDHSDIAWWDPATPSPVAHRAAGFRRCAMSASTATVQAFCGSFPNCPSPHRDRGGPGATARAVAWAPHRRAHCGHSARPRGGHTGRFGKVRALLAPATPSLSRLHTGKTQSPKQRQRKAVPSCHMLSLPATRARHPGRTFTPPPALPHDF